MAQINQEPEFREVDASGRRRLTDGRQIPAHRHRQGQLLYPAAGVLATTTARGTWVAPADCITWTPAGHVHGHRAYGVTDLRLLQLSRADVASLPDQPTVFTVTPLLREAFLVLTDDRRQLSSDAQDRLCRVILDELTSVSEKSLYLPEPRDDRLRAVTDLLHENPGDTSTLVELGRRVGASERTLSRLFQAELGLNFHQWRTLLRVQHALVHLLDGRTVTQTAMQCGWANPTSFIDAFSAVVGKTPGRYQTELAHRD